MKRLVTGSALVFVLLLSGCPKLSTSAKIMKSFRISLSAYQDAEIGAFQKGFILQAKHVHNEADIEKLASFAIIVDQAILASDKATVAQDITNALAIVNEIEANDVIAIGDQTTRAGVEVAVAGLKNLLIQVSIAIGGK